MTFENSKYSKRFAYTKEVFSFGILYATKYFVVSELNEGIHVDYDIASEIISRFSSKINDDTKIVYVANRFNSYSSNPQLWVDFNNDYDFLIASAIVSYSDFSYLNASLEKQFFNKSLKRCNSLDEALEWALNLKEFKNVNQN
ncbi:hypothetical protein [Winogradskyella bathintestinalis]|uniref:STAS/SEC14 domain-containing protein n=1 Tax=Winogradskyella bathintestinalis TaxID=3035208 RepID=A0ABT7ZSW4_9FLAO|nr:hypothetical protein [Winogradskyella bathintestinalis]MDN3492090.1 hypothetical protein [Winogradskyella bathintestinalis]